MKTLIYGMQSSGASLFAYFMGQGKDSVVVIDLFNRNIAPFIEFEEVVLKCVVTTKYTWEDHVTSFKPDKTILFLRNPFDNYISLRQKAWHRESGTVENKMAVIERDFVDSDKFDTVVLYEDLVINTDKVVEDLKIQGFHVDESFKDFSRSIDDMAVFNYAHIPSYCCRKDMYYQRGKFGKGRLHIRSGPMLKRKYIKKNIDDELKDRIKEICPTLCEFYGDKTW